VSDETQVDFEQVNVLVASVRSPKGRAEVRLWCDGKGIKLVIRFERKLFNEGWVKQDMWLGQSEPYGLTFDQAVTLIREKLNEKTL
jgi:hypothetical protein